MRTDFSDSDIITINGFTYSADMATLLSVDKDVSSLNEMQRGVRYIGEEAFEGCEKLRMVRIPETVIRIEDFAFRDCPNIQEVHLPYDMEYISPLAFTFSEEASDSFYNTNFMVVIPKDAFLKYTYMIPQFVSEWDNEEYGVTNEKMKSVEGWDEEEGLPIYVNENELYRMAYLDAITKWDLTEHQEEWLPDKVVSDVGVIGQMASHKVFSIKLIGFIAEKEIVPMNNSHLLEHLDGEFDSLINNQICSWLKYSWNYRPVVLIYEILLESLWLGFEKKTGIGRMSDSGLDSVIRLDTEALLRCFCKEYYSNGYPINAIILKSIVRQAMELLFRCGYSFGIQYVKHNPNIIDLKLFGDEEM